MCLKWFAHQKLQVDRIRTLMALEPFRTREWTKTDASHTFKVNHYKVSSLPVVSWHVDKYVFHFLLQRVFWRTFLMQAAVANFSFGYLKQKPGQRGKRIQISEKLSLESWISWSLFVAEWLGFQHFTQLLEGVGWSRALRRAGARSERFGSPSWFTAEAGPISWPKAR